MCNRILNRIFQDTFEFVGYYNSRRHVPADCIIQSVEDFEKTKTIISLIRTGDFVTARKKQAIEFLSLFGNGCSVATMSKRMGISNSYVHSISSVISSSLNARVPKDFLDHWANREFDFLISCLEQNQLGGLNKEVKTLLDDYRAISEVLSIQSSAAKKTGRNEIYVFSNREFLQNEPATEDVKQWVEDALELRKAMAEFRKVFTTENSKSLNALSRHLENGGYLSPEERTALTALLTDETPLPEGERLTLEDGLGFDFGKLDNQGPLLTVEDKGDDTNNVDFSSPHETSPHPFGYEW